MPGRWSSTVLNTLVAPNFTSFTEATIPDLRDRFPEAPHWLSNFFLNSALRARYNAPVYQVVLGYLRRAHHGFIAYHEARQATLDFLTNRDPYQATLRPFYAAVVLWENFALQICMAIDLHNWLNKGDRAFRRNDGSKEQRLYDIANQVKHVGSCVDSGQCTERETLPLWLSNAGLLSFNLVVSYSEASEVLADVASLADLLQDPLSLREEREEAPAAGTDGSV